MNLFGPFSFKPPQIWSKYMVHLYMKMTLINLITKYYEDIPIKYTHLKESKIQAMTKLAVLTLVYIFQIC